ncbi:MULTISPECIES: D-xylose ABC transporter substrate-binding protein [unclassified Meiothermus]|uniref:D-xylose ABC transporter substrate-binding protein n=1 Tax=unclassified Meiothermus TaxID=370471 RepID=UPI000D7C4667|nr:MULTISPECIES: D-xylose ABC transporter substrate-binding protein [unclassified Meiothermus]PZA07213.1 D-xylose ABC transporter substrate-binding protein [Meiothermus sp. Pnk-1]RYM40042.1 D-xylose ABC transporter substrate-binding protein [Meiothermus sp. PNK-Is4]
MKLFLKAILLVLLLAAPALAQKKVIVGVSWANFQEERWKIDEAAIRQQLGRMGADYISADAQSSSEKQLNDIDALISRGANALIILAWDKDAILPAIDKAKAAGIPVVAYDRLIENDYAYYITFDNVEVGRMQARAVYAVKPKGNYAFILGANTDPNADFLHKGQLEVLQPAINRGDIKVVGKQYTEGWKPEVAQRNMEQILAANGNKVDAVVASNDGTAGGVVAALAAVGLAGKVPVSGQDGDQAALNRVARGLQTVSVWKDARELGKKAAEAAVLMARGTPKEKLPGRTVFADGPNKVKMNALLLKPIPITRQNLDVVLKAGWITKEALCQGVSGANAPAACR